MQRLEEQQSTLQAENHQLEADIAALSSLDRIEHDARDRLGMIPARKIEYVSVDTPAPSGPLLPRPILALPEGQPPSQTDSWLDSLLKVLPLP